MNVLERLRGGLIVSVQAAPGSPLDRPEVIAAMAQAAVEGGASAVRIQGVANIKQVRAAVSVPLVGLIKRDYKGHEPYITPTLREVEEVLAAGAAVVAFDATHRERPGGISVQQIMNAIHAGGAPAMADCAEIDDGLRAAELGCEIVASTLCGYTTATRGATLPAFDLIRAWRRSGAFVICEGGVHEPAHVAHARACGADAVVVGTAITNLQWVTARFAAALRSDA